MTEDRFARRRAEFLARLGNAIAIIPSGAEQVRNDDVHHAFRQDSDFFFLTGFPEPDAVAVFDTASDDPFTLFVRDRDPEMEAWNGRRAGTEGAIATYGADDAHPIGEFADVLRRRLRGRSRVAYTLGGPHDAAVLAALGTARDASERLGIDPPHEIVDPRNILHEMRLVKSADEIAALREACRISAIAHVEAMRYATPGRTERQVQAAVEYVFASMGAERVGYGSIVAGGENAVILHYVENDQPLRDGDLLLIDAGAEYRHLTADITRTFPVNGAFTGPQRALYDVVLAAEREVVSMCAPGLRWTSMHERSIEVLTRGMVDLGLIPGPVEDAIAKGWYRQFFFHGTGHWLGVDVHDAGAYRVDGAGRSLSPGMAFTVEPGIYVDPGKATVELSHAPYDPDEALRLAFDLGATAARAEMERRREEAGTLTHSVPADFLGLGVRIEDDILVTASGHENLSALAPVDPDAIEALCGETTSLPTFG